MTYSQGSNPLKVLFFLSLLSSSVLLAVSAFAATDRLAWLDSRAGEGTSPTAPFTALSVDVPTRTIRLLGRELVLAKSGLPAQYRSYFTRANTAIGTTARDFLAAPMTFTNADGAEGFRFTKTSPTEIAWESKSSDLVVRGSIGFDGCCRFHILTEKLGPQALEIDLPKANAKYWMGLGRTGGRFPEDIIWNWDAGKQQDAAWFGDVNAGMMIRFKDASYERPLVNVYYALKPLKVPASWGAGGSVSVHNGGEIAQIRASSVPCGSGESFDFAFDLYLTPFKPIDVASQLADRYYQVPQHTEKLDFAALRAQGVSIVNLHHNTLWNPFINFPYTDAALPCLKAAVNDAHKAGLRLKVYYTTREITQQMPEFAALAKTGDVVFRTADGKPVSAWREQVAFSNAPYAACEDLAVLTRPDTRWNNFYLAGLDYLVREVGIDGLYVDDTAMNRETMLRARRILDADGNMGRRIDFHSWNHFDPRAGEASSAIVYMEIFPFLNRLWFGEGFSPDNSPEYWLVERSGIPFGLVAEQLQGISFFRGLTVGMLPGRPGWVYQQHSPAVWKLADEFHLAKAEMVGWWDEHCPVTCDNPDIRATLWRLKDGGALVAVANFSRNPAKGALKLDFAALGLDPRKVRVTLPEIAGIQKPGAFSLSDELDLGPDGGCLLRVGFKAEAGDPLAEGFANPFGKMRTACYWYWLSGHISAEGARKDIAAMAKGGIDRAFMGDVGANPWGQAPV